MKQQLIKRLHIKQKYANKCGLLLHKLQLYLICKCHFDNVKFQIVAKILMKEHVITVSLLLKIYDPLAGRLYEV